MSEEGPILIGVYNANGGLFGELVYVLGKTLRLTQCALCDLSHGYVHEKQSVRRWRQTLPIPFSFQHLNELDPAVRSFVKDQTPCVVLQAYGSLSIFIDHTTLSSMNGFEDRFFAEVGRRLSRL